MARTLKLATTVGISAFFVLMWGLLIRSQMGAGRGTALRPDYGLLLGPGQTERATSWGVYFSGRRIGESETRVVQDDAGTIFVRTQTTLRVGPVVAQVLGIPAELDLKFELVVSPLRGPQYFVVASEKLDTEVRGAVNVDRLVLSGHVGQERLDATVPYDGDRFLGAMLAPMAALPRLSAKDVGKSWALELVNPLTGEVQSASVSVLRAIEVQMPDGIQTVFQLMVTAGSTQWASWVNQNGETLVQGTPFGLTLRRADLPEEVAQLLTAESSPVAGG